MDRNKEIRDELRELGASFSGMEKREGFRVPENYFDDLQEEMLRKVRAEGAVIGEPSESPGRKPQGRRVLMRSRFLIGVAAAFVLLLAAVFIFRQGQAGPSNPDLANLSPDEAMQYVLENIEDFEDEWIMEIASEEVRIEELLHDEFPADELDEYLDDVLLELDDAQLEELL